VDTRQLGQSLLTCYTSASSLVELHVHPPRLALIPGERPLATPLARLQATRGNQVTNLRHELVGLGDFERHVLRHLDGTRDRAALADVLTALVREGALTVQEGGQVVEDGQKLTSRLGQALDEQLPKLARNALLQA
jgi:hypothetical protein